MIGHLNKKLGFYLFSIAALSDYMASNAKKKLENSVNPIKS